MQYPSTELISSLGFFQSRLRFARSVVIVPRALVLCCALLVLATAIQVLLHQPTSGWLPLILFLVFGWGCHLALHHEIGSFDVARLVDRRAGLQAQLATAVEFTAARRLDEPLARTQVRQATARIRSLEPGRVVPLVWPGAEVRLLALLLALYAGLSFLGAMGLTIPRPPQKIDTELAALASQDPQAPSSYVTMNAAQAQIQSSATTSDQASPKLQTLQQQLADHTITPQQYRGQLQQLQSQIQAQANQSLAAQQALSALATALKDSSTTRPISDSLAQGNYQQAASQLNALSKNLDKLSPQAQSELQSALANAAAQTSQSDSAMSQSAQQAANALKQGNQAQAAQSMQSLANSVSQASGKIATQAQLGQALQNVQSQLANQTQGQSPQGQSQSANAQSAAQSANGANAANSQSANAQVTPGAAQSQGQPSGGPSDGNASQSPSASAANGTGAQGNGSTSQSAQPATGQQIQQDQAGAGGGAGNGPGSDGLTNKPTPLDVNGVKVVITGQASGTGNAQKQAGDRTTPLTGADGSTISSPGSAAPAASNVPINAHQESNVVPIQLKPIVREYFSNAGS